MTTREHGHVGADSVLAADVNEQGTPPIGGVLCDDASGFELPEDAALPVEGLAQLRIFAQGLLGLGELIAQLLIFPAQFLDLFKEGAARHEGVAGLFDEVPRCAGDAEERQEQTSDGELEFSGCRLGQVEHSEHDEQDQADCYVILPL